MKLEDIGFYTLSDERAKKASSISPLKRVEILITNQCNFKCPYCRGIKREYQGQKSYNELKNLVNILKMNSLENIRFSGGEPTTHPELLNIISYTKQAGVKRIAISTNGSASLNYYKKLIKCGVNDISVSLDACCSSVGEKMCGVKNVWSKIVQNIKELSKITYVTVGVVFTDDNLQELIGTIKFAHGLGVSDIRIIPAAQFGNQLKDINCNKSILKLNPILNYRINNFLLGRKVRGISSYDNHSCPLVLDDLAIVGDYHFPCIIYLREQGNPIGKINSNIRRDRQLWYSKHNTFNDRICRDNCLDVCVDYNNKYKEYH
jgi:MoaA/NifB/PqqE/SkfB family radical SAM enzyme